VQVKDAGGGHSILKPREEKPESGIIAEVGADPRFHSRSPAARLATRVLVNGESFAVFEPGGDVLERRREPLGFFHRDTRYLSRFEFRIAGERPRCLASAVCNENAELRVNLCNPDLSLDGGGDGRLLPNDSIEIERDWVIAGPALFHKMVLRNRAALTVELPIDFLFSADFADVFEVRGLKRKRRGEFAEPELEHDAVRFRYRGLDGKLRSSRVKFDRAPAELEAGRASFRFALAPDERRELEVTIAGACDGASVQVPARFEGALADRRSELARYSSGWTRITASDESLDALIARSSSDLTSIIQYAPEGTFPMAGIPWFATLFGRDSLLTAMFVLPFNPALVVGTLKTLARLQGSEVNHSREEQPGKIIHEIRGGEVAATSEVPFGRYYGSVDSTPLFLWLIGAYAATTGDLKLPLELWDNVERGLEWIEQWGDRDGDLYVEYLREGPRGLVNHGWKDSFDAISHSDGTLASPPLALCEVQAYVYASYLSIAEVARRLGRESLADRLEERAALLKAQFSRDFWIEEEQSVALALDAEKRPCRVMASNAAHCLAAGLLDNRQAAALANRLLSEEMFSGWGIRTLSAREQRYNPMSYHNGSVWPHDNAIAAAGLRRLPNRQGILKILEGLLQAAVQLKSGSLPELFCGFERDGLAGPVPYPVACHPQAWSAASVFMIVRAMLGIDVRGFERKVIIDAPAMPEWLDWLRVEDLRVADGAVSFIARRAAGVPEIEILERKGGVAVEIRR